MKRTFLKGLAFSACLFVSSLSIAQNNIITTFAGDGTTGYSGDGGSATDAQLQYPTGVTCDNAGNIFVCDRDNHVVRKINSAGVISTIAGDGTDGNSGDGGQATDAQLSQPMDVVVDASNNVYIADYGTSTIRKVNAAGIISTFAGGGISGYISSGPATSATFGALYAIAIDAAGNIYSAGIGGARVYKITPAGYLSTYVGTGTSGNTGNGGPATDATMWAPTGVTVDANDNVFVYDLGSSNGLIRKVTSGGIIDAFAGGGIDFLSDNIPATDALIPQVNSIITDAAGNVYLTGGAFHTVRKIDTAGNIDAIAGIAPNIGFSGDGGPATNALVNTPFGIAIDAVGNLYFSDRNNQRVRKIAADLGGADTICAGATTTMTSANLSGGVWTSSNPGIATVNSTTGEVTGVSGGVATISYTLNGFVATGDVVVLPVPSPGPITGPSSVIVSGTISLSSATPGGVWSSCNNSVAVVNGIGNVSGYSNGSALISYTVTNACGSSTVTFPVTVGSCVAATNISTIAGNHIPGYSGDGGPASEAQITAPHAVVADAYGNVYVADRFNHVIRKINPSGIISTIAGTGVAGFSGDGGPAAGAALNNPAGLALDGDGNLYIADMYNERIRKIDLSGNISTVAGNGYHGGWMGAAFGNGGPATDAALVYPIALAVSCSGEMYISEYGSQRVRKVDANGIISNFAGTARAGYNGDGLPATDAELNHPHGIAIDVEGNVYIADAWNNRVRVVEATTGKMWTYAGNGAAAYAGDGMPKGSASLWIPWGLTFDACGNLYICDYNNNAVRVVDKSSTYMSTFAGNGQRGWGYTGDGGPATDASIYLPSSLAIDGFGNIYIADYGNNLIRLIGSTGYAARSYAGGTTQFLNTCEGKTTTVDDLMAISDATGSANWTVGIAPQHGTLEGFTGATSAKGGMILPQGVTYTPEAGFSGKDEFTIVVNDGTSTAATTITAIVNPLPNVGEIVSTPSFTDNAITLANPTADEGGVWSSSNTAIATVDQMGNVTGHANGVVTISYTMTNECGAKSATTTIVTEANIPAPATLVLFPNPTNGSFACEFSSDNDAELNLVIADVTGRVVYNESVSATAGLNRVSVSLPDGISTGLLMVSLGNENTKYNTQKITLTR